MELILPFLGVLTVSKIINEK